MRFFNRSQVHLVVFILFLFLIPFKINSQHNHDHIYYRDKFTLYSPFLPIIFDGNHLDLTDSLKPKCPLEKYEIRPLIISKNNIFTEINNKNTFNRNTYKYLIKNNLKQIKYTTADFEGKSETIEAISSNVFQHIFKVDSDIENNSIAKPERFHPKRKYWISNGNHKIQLSQNFMTENWYKGGGRYLNLINRHDMSFNYKKDKFQANNLIEWRLNLYTNPNDTIHQYRFGEDLIRTYSNFGIQAFNNWYYSLFVEIKTQAFKNFQENSEKAISSVLSPIFVNIGLLGMRYQIDKTFPKVKGRKISFNTEISPLSIEYKAVFNKDIDPTRFGIMEGSRHLINYGSTVNAKLIYNINRGVNITTRFYYFTNYEKVTAELENTLNFPINRYFSTSLYLFFRFDDNPQLKKEKNLGYFQLNELLSFGFNYTW